jgi:hypothetical protein
MVPTILTPEDNNAPEKTLAEFWGILSDETANELRVQIEKSRKEWERDINGLIKP